MKLTAEQTEDLPFPVGCPVWYRGAASDGSAELPLLKRGVVREVSFDLSSKAMLYSICNEGHASGDTVTEDVAEDRLAFGASCPVRILFDGEAVDGTVLLSGPSGGNPSKIVYTVMLSNGGQCHWREGVDGELISYRRVSFAEEPNDRVAEASRAEKKDSLADEAAIKGEIFSRPANRLDEESVPASITCSSRASSGGGESSSTKKMRLDLTAVTQSSKEGALKCSESKEPRETSVTMTIPLWLQGTHQCQKNVFFHLIGSIRNGRRGVKDIERETNCRVEVNFNPRRAPTADTPITVSIDALRKPSAQLDLRLAREEIQDLLLAYIQPADPGAGGRLLYELAVSFEGAHRPEHSSSRAVRVRDPFKGKHGIISLVELPFRLTAEGKKACHPVYLLTKSCLKRYSALDCHMQLCAEGFKVPVRLCDAYVLVTGNSFQAVDQGVEFIEGIIRGHMHYCNCAR